jgi:hypothetical protein
MNLYRAAARPLAVTAIALFALTTESDVFAQSFKTPSRQLVSDYEACVAENLVELDDAVSEASTIAAAINTLCRDKLEAMIKSSIPSSDAELVAFRKMKIVVPSYEEQVLPRVLQRRSSMRQKQS